MGKNIKLRRRELDCSATLQQQATDENPPRHPPGFQFSHPEVRPGSTHKQLISGYRNEAYLTAFAGGISGGLVRVPILYGALSGVAGVTWEVLALNLTNPIDCHVASSGAILVAEYSTKQIRAIHPVHKAVITIEGQPSIGMTCPLTFSAPDYPGDTIMALASGALGPTLPLPNNLEFYLDLSSFVVGLSTTPGNPYINLPFPGVLDASGQTTGSFVVPNDPALIGFELQVQFIVLGATTGGFQASSPPQKVVFLPPF